MLCWVSPDILNDRGVGAFYFVCSVFLYCCVSFCLCICVHVYNCYLSAYVFVYTCTTAICLLMYLCTRVQLPPGDNTIAVNKYHISSVKLNHEDVGNKIVRNIGTASPLTASRHRRLASSVLHSHSLNVRHWTRLDTWLKELHDIWHRRHGRIHLNYTCCSHRVLQTFWFSDSWETCSL